MTLIPAPNKTLKGHKLLILTVMETPPAALESIKAEFPNLEIVTYRTEFNRHDPTPPFPPEEWRDVTILLTFAIVPKPHEAPKLQYVQLLSAGANLILDTPLFKETDVTFASANGVHG